MSTLYLVRHGQASFGQANYDKLSELGERQCRILGEFWAARGIRLDAVYTGTLERQTASADCAREAFEKAGVDFPDHARIAGFNEYDTAGILSGSIPDLIAWWCDRDGVRPDKSRNRKGSTWVLSLAGGRLVAADHVSSPLALR